MGIEVHEMGPAALGEYAGVPIAFWVTARLRVEWVRGELEGIRMVEEAVDPPYLKDYDALDESPASWASRWDISRWGVFLARDGVEAVGGAAVVKQWAGPFVADAYDGVGALVDLRVRPGRKREGIGRKLMERAMQWAMDRGCRGLKVETQNINLPACRFYAACGGRLYGIQPGAYAGLPEEVKLLWHLPLRGRDFA